MRTCIEAFHRDELAHSELGFVLLPDALERVERAMLGDELRMLRLD